MIGTFQTIFQVFQWVGSLFGLIGGIILIIRFFKERPILKIEFFSSHNGQVDEETTAFDITLDIDNIGDKPTTIKEINFMIEDKHEKDTWYYAEFEEFKMSHLNPRSSMKFSEEVIIEEYFGDDIYIEVTVEHTHGNENKKTESFNISKILLDEDDYIYEDDP